jgi:Iap family predicted aminopeptidase
MIHVRALAGGIGPRIAGTASERKGAQYIVGVMRGFGYQVRVEGGIPIRGREGTTQDILATSSRHLGNETLILGAHYDSMIGPGANDNASGVAVLLDTARLLADHPLAYRLVFAFFGAEEVHHEGSWWLVRAGRLGQVKGMIAVDMIGLGDRLYLNYAAGPNEVGERLRRAAWTIGLDLVKQIDDSHSDHEAFERAGIPAAWLQRLPDAENHSAGDRVERIRPKYVQEVVDLVCTCLMDDERSIFSPDDAPESSTDH